MTHQAEAAPFSPLVADILTAMTSQTAATTNIVIDNLTERAEIAEATVAAIRAEVQRLLNGPYLPHPKTVLSALWPTDADRARYRQKGDI